MSDELGVTLERLAFKVMRHMSWDCEKFITWFRAENPLLGNVSPAAMIAIGRAEKLERWIDTQIDENSAPV